MLTLGELVDRYFELHLKGRASFYTSRRLYQQFFSTWNHPTQQEIRTWHAARRATPIHANKGVIFLRAVYGWAIAHGYWDGPNPAAGIRRYPSESRERVLCEDEVAALRDGLPLLPQKFSTFLMVALLTGARLSEIRLMRWTDVTSAGRWTKRRTKNGRGQVVYIPVQALTRLQALPKTGDFCFMGLYDRCWSRAAVEKAWRQWRPALGLPDVWIHDLRRTLATRLYEQTGDLYLVKACLNHYDGSPTAVYVRLQYDRIAKALQAHADSIFPRPEPQPGDVVCESFVPPALLSVLSSSPDA